MSTALRLVSTTNFNGIISGAMRRESSYVREKLWYVQNFYAYWWHWLAWIWMNITSFMNLLKKCKLARRWLVGLQLQLWNWCKLNDFLSSSDSQFWWLHQDSFSQSNQTPILFWLTDRHPNTLTNQFLPKLVTLDHISKWKYQPGLDSIYPTRKRIHQH